MQKLARPSPLLLATSLLMFCLVQGCGQGADHGTESHSAGNVDWEKLARISAPHGEGSRLTALPSSVLLPALLSDVSKVSGLSARWTVPMVEVDAEEHLAHVDELAQRENENLGLQAMFLGSEAAFAALGVERQLAGDAHGQDEDEFFAGTEGDATAASSSVLQGYYDPSEKTFYIDSRLSPEQRMETIRHELMHALQDQHFHLNELLVAAFPDLDRVMAYKAVVEGMADVAAIQSQRIREDHFLLLPALRRRAARMTYARRSARERMPLGLHFQDPRSTTDSAFLFASDMPNVGIALFPYEAGDRFFATLMSAASYRHMSFADWVQETFRFMPQSTHDILHPMQWAASRGEPLAEPLRLTALKQVPQHRVQWESALGELVMRAYLAQQPHGDALAAAMVRDRVAVLEQPASTVPVVAWVTDWQDEATAQAIYDAAQAIQRDLMRSQRKRGVTPGYAFVRLEGRRVGLLANIARDNSHPRADKEHQHLLAQAMEAALLEP